MYFESSVHSLNAHILAQGRGKIPSFLTQILSTHFKLLVTAPWSLQSSSSITHGWVVVSFGCGRGNDNISGSGRTQLSESLQMLSKCCITDVHTRQQRSDIKVKQSVAGNQHPNSFNPDRWHIGLLQSDLSGSDSVVSSEASGSSQRKSLTTLFPVTGATLQLFHTAMKHQITKQTSCGLRFVRACTCEGAFQCVDLFYYLF